SDVCSSDLRTGSERGLTGTEEKNLGSLAREKKFVHNLVSSLTKTLFGGIAQLGERLHGMQEVSGSIPLTSTKLSLSNVLSPSSRGLGHHPFTVSTGVRIP